jgi:microcystin-dependent protein
LGWTPCNGRLLIIRQYQALMTLIGTTYGGDGKTTFALPNLPPLGPSGPGYYMAIRGTAPTR